MLGRVKPSKSSRAGTPSSSANLIPDAKADIKAVYHIDATELGSGTFATVRRCRHRETNELYAVKIITKKNLGAGAGLLLSEVEIMRAVEHPSIIKLIDVFESSHHIYMVMELVTGGELFDQIVARGRFTEADASAIMKQIFSALQYLHERKIVHRDLKPENVLCGTNDPAIAPVVKIADFGLSKVVGHETTLKTACGSPSYVAPEVLSQSYDGYTDEVDLWSAGVIMYILLSGFPPFYSEQTAELFEQIQLGRYDFPSPYWDDISESAKDLIRKLLVVDPNVRLTATQALAHPWVVQAPDVTIDGFVERMYKMNKKRAFKKAIFSVLAFKDGADSSQ